MYNMTNITNANTPYEILKTFNDLGNGMFFSLVFFILLITYMIVFKKQNFKDVLLAGSFANAVIALFLFVLKFVGQNFLITPIVIFFAALLMYLFVET